ncbi:MAG: lipoate--protein ligase family protein [Methanomassiliicoccales archaeon]|nr:lipoate--protein ligase family protein [Methanomassiliicoccales archaeon]
MARYETFPLAIDLALDDAIVEAVSFRMAGPTIRFHGAEPSAVSIGQSQKIDGLVDIERCRKLGIDMVRRNTEGNAYFHDVGKEISFSIICPEEMISKDLDRVYEEVGGWVVNALKLIGIVSSFEGPNEVVVDGKTICHLFQSRPKGTLLIQGNFLYDIDRPTMFSLIRPSAGLGPSEERLTSLRELKKLPWEYAMAALVNALILNKQWYAGDLTRDEMVRAELIAQQRYGKEEWTFGQPSH